MRGAPWRGPCHEVTRLLLATARTDLPATVPSLVCSSMCCSLILGSFSSSFHLLPPHRSIFCHPPPRFCNSSRSLSVSSLPFLYRSLDPRSSSSPLSSTMSHISNDWLSREFQQNIQYNIMQVATLLNTFDTSTRFKLAQLNEKLTKIERQMEYIECSLKNITNPENAQGAAGQQ